MQCEGSGGKGRDAYGAGEVGHWRGMQLLQDRARVVGGDGENGARVLWLDRLWARLV